MIAETMMAVRTYGPRDYRLEEIPVPKPGPGELLIEVGACGICASDMKCWLGGELFWGAEGKGGYVEGPCTAGHEYAGRVVALGDGAGNRHGVSLGDRVVAEQIVPCGECRYCQSGQYWMCRRHFIFGFKRQTNGGMARYNLFPAQALVHKVPDSLSEGEAAYIEPAACAWHAVDRGEIKEGDAVVIGGVGNIGLCMLQIAKMSKPGLAHRARFQTIPPGARQAARSRCRDRRHARRRGSARAGVDWRLRLRCLYRGERQSGGHHAGFADDPEAGHVRGIQRFQ